MNDEIKEILEALDNTACCPYHDDICKKAKNYITNLQQENKILRKNAEHNDKVVDNAKWNEMIYKSRIDKAKEYIMSNLITEWDIKNGGCVSGSDLPADAITPILDILDGCDKNDNQTNI